MARPVGRPPDSPAERFRRHIATATPEELAYLKGYMDAAVRAREDELKRAAQMEEPIPLEDPDA